MKYSIENIDKVISNYKKKLIEIESANWIIKLLNKRRISNNIKKLEIFRFKIVKDYLENNDIEFKNLIHENYELIKRAEIYFKVQSSVNSFFGTYAKKFSGELMQNGLIYCKSYETNFGLTIFDSLCYTESLGGKIDYLGNIYLKTEDIGQAFHKNLPEMYFGKIKDEGEIELRIVDKSFGFGGSSIIYQMTAQLFHKDSKSLKQFELNKNRIKKMINEFKNL